MKTLHFTNSWHATSGGIATFYRALMDAANRRGHEMVLVVPGVEEKTESVGAYGRIHYVAAPLAPMNGGYRMMFPGKYITRSSRLRQILNEERPDIIEVCDKYTLNYFAGMLRTGMLGDVSCRPITVALTCERMDDNVRAYLGWSGLAAPLVQFYMKWLYFSFFDAHIANSAYTAEELRNASAGHTIRRGVWVRPMGVDFHGLSPAHKSAQARKDLLKKVGAPHEATSLLLYVGRLAREKNLALLLDTLSVLRQRDNRDWRLVLVGDGAERASLLKQANRRTQGAVAWLGHMRDRAELGRIYANSDAFVHPNPREPFGIAPLEAMASGLPLVAPDRGGVTTYANSGNAWVVSPDAGSFADAVESIVSDPSSRTCKTAEALCTAAQFRWENAAGSFLNLYEDLFRTAQGEPCRIPADFLSTAPPSGNGSPVARFTAGVFQRLLATR